MPERIVVSPAPPRQKKFRVQRNIRHLLLRDAISLLRRPSSIILQMTEASGAPAHRRDNQTVKIEHLTDIRGNTAQLFAFQKNTFSPQFSFFAPGGWLALSKFRPRLNRFAQAPDSIETSHVSNVTSIVPIDGGAALQNQFKAVRFHSIKARAKPIVGIKKSKSAAVCEKPKANQTI